MKLRIFSGVLVLVSALVGGSVSAEEFRVKMLTIGESGDLVFEPSFLKINAGDTVVFEPTDKGHNVESIRGMVPEGAMTWKSGFNKEVKLTFETEGVYGYRCTPHYLAGMVGLIVVGESLRNLNSASTVTHRGLARDRFAELFRLARADDTEEASLPSIALSE